MNAVIPAAMARRLMARMLAKTVAAPLRRRRPRSINAKPQGVRNNRAKKEVHKMAKTTEQSNKALVLEAFDTLFNKRDYKAAER